MYKVLLADDETEVRDRLVKNLMKMDIPLEVVGAAGDGQEALDIALDKKPDIVITDIAMPVFNGLELIRRMQEAGLQTKNIVISGYDEFDYARTAISLGVTDYLLKPFLPSEMKEVLEKIVRELDNRKAFDKNLEQLVRRADKSQLMEREQALKRILSGDASETDIRMLGYQCEAGKDQVFQCCLLSVNGSVWNFQPQDNFFQFVNELTSGYFGRDLRVEAAGCDSKNVMLMFCSENLSEAAFQEAVLKGLRRFTASFQKYYDIVIYCTLGRLFRSVQEAEFSCKDAMNAWKHTLVPGSRIQFYDSRPEIPQKTVDEVKARIRETKRLIRAEVTVGNSKDIEQLLQRLIKLYAELPEQGSDYIYISAQDLILQICDDLVEKGCQRPDLRIMTWLSGRDNVISLSELQRQLEVFLHRCCDTAREAEDEQKAKFMVRMAQDYIGQHLQDVKLSIEEIAGVVNFSASYLRQIFKDQTGENLGEYIIRSRMERAGDYLLHTSMKISEVAERCGYDNQRYFASSFKKYYGCTPTEYKSGHKA